MSEAQGRGLPIVEPFEEELERSSPGFREEVQNVVHAQLALTGPFLVDAEIPRACRVIVNLAASDLGDLLHDVARGSGRAAMRSARSLVEHAINMHTVAASEQDADRYLDHLSLGPSLMMKSELPMIGLDAKRRSQVEHALRKSAREAATAWEAARQRYGASFARSWHPKNLADRAAAAGCPELYDDYRIASNVAHGSAAGSYGHFYRSKSDLASFATGAVPHLVPHALMMGIEGYVTTIEICELVAPRHDLTLAHEVVTLLLEERYIAVWDVANDRQRRITQSFDREEPNSTALLAFSRGGKFRWYVELDGSVEGVFRAHEPYDAEEVIASLESLIQVYRDGHGEFNEGGWSTIRLPGLAAIPRFEVSAIPRGAILPCLELNADWSECLVAIEILPDGSMEYLYPPISALEDSLPPPRVELPENWRSF